MRAKPRRRIIPLVVLTMFTSQIVSGKESDASFEFFLEESEIVSASRARSRSQNLRFQ